MPDNLDTLAAKAEALEYMRLRGDKAYPEALALFERERQAWVDTMSSQVLGISIEHFNYLKEFGLKHNRED